MMSLTVNTKMATTNTTCQKTGFDSPAYPIQSTRKNKGEFKDNQWKVERILSESELHNSSCFRSIVISTCPTSNNEKTVAFK